MHVAKQSMKNKFLIWGFLKCSLPNSFLPYLAPEAVNTLDNASIHSILITKVPCLNKRRAGIMAWLSSKTHLSRDLADTRSFTAAG
jgi:hypothetical protein